MIPIQSKDYKSGDKMFLKIYNDNELSDCEKKNFQLLICLRSKEPM